MMLFCWCCSLFFPCGRGFFPGRNLIVLQVFIFDVETSTQALKSELVKQKLNAQVINYSPRDKLFSYTRPLLDVTTSSEQAYT